jgi:uncharacterized protein (TIGR00369 family)
MGTTETIQEPRLDLQRLEEARLNEHRWCFACGEHHPFGLHLAYQTPGDGTLRTRFHCGKSYEGYEGRLHGGIVTTLLDSAMVSWLMAAGITAYTAEITVRFHLPADIGEDVEITALRASSRGPIHRMEARLSQGGVLRATAKARFLEPRA